MILPSQRTRAGSSRPPYDIVKTGDDTYRITVAVAGFSQDDLTLTSESNLLIISGNKGDTSQEGYLYHGIAGRPFEHRFELADHVRVTSAELTNGLLSIDLIREIPEAMKPRRIEIQSAQGSEPPVQIEGQKVA